MGSLILFVFSGNTCRSPMAEALLRQALPPASPWRVASAGLAAFDGCRASEPAVAAVAELGADLRDHRSQRVTPQLIQDAAAVIAMTDGHAQQILARFPSACDRLFLMRAFDPDAPVRSDVCDPFSGSLDDYRYCRDLIRKALPGLLRHLAQKTPTDF